MKTTLTFSLALMTVAAFAGYPEENEGDWFATPQRQSQQSTSATSSASSYYYEEQSRPQSTSQTSTYRDESRARDTSYDFSRPEGQVGPGQYVDQTGRTFEYRSNSAPPWEPANTQPVKRDVYGPGIGQDQYSRPVHAQPVNNFGW